MKLTKNTAISSSDDAGFENLVNRIVSLVSKTKDHLLRHIDDTLVIYPKFQTVSGILRQIIRTPQDVVTDTFQKIPVIFAQQRRT